MKSIRMLSLALALGLASVQVSCSKDDAKQTNGSQNEYVDSLYATVKDVERDLSQGYLLRNATDRERTSFQDVLYEIKVAAMRLRKDANDGDALSSLYLASQSFNTLSILEIDGSQLGVLKNKLFETLDVLARMQGKTLDNIERVLFEKLFTYDLAPFTAFTDGGKNGWYKANHEDISYAYASGSKMSSWLFTPTLDLTNVTNPSFKITQAISNRSNPIEGSVFFLVSENYTGGDPSAATWDIINIDRLPDGSGFTVVDSENVSLKRYQGKKIVMAFHYDSRTASSYPIWQINSFNLLGSGTFASTPLTLTGGATAGSTGGVAPGAGAGAAAVACAGTGSKNMFSYQFTNKDLGDNFSVIDPAKAVTTLPTGYPGVVRLSGYNADTKGNNVGTAWLVSKKINLNATKDACISVSEDIYLGKGANADDLSSVAVLVSTDYTGDVNTATWKPVPLKNRKSATGLVNKTDFAPAAIAVSVKSLIGDSAANVTVAFRYTVTSTDSVASPAAWWGIADLTVAAVPTSDAAVVTPTTGVATATPSRTPVAAATPAPIGKTFSLASVQDSTWESSCYRFSDKGDYTKRYIGFSATAMTTLQAKYSDAACTTLSTTLGSDGKPKVISTWVIGAPVATALEGDWAVTVGTCSKGCTGEVKTALRMNGALLNEGSKISNSNPEAYNIAETKYVSFTKAATALDLEALATTLTEATAAAVAALPAATPRVPTPAPAPAPTPAI